MSDASEKVLGIKHLPIFPLPVVLMPFELMPLHIFEERYKQMLEDIKSEKNLFGLSYFNLQESLVDKPASGSIGCVAEVRDVQTLPEERSNILTIGVIRYRILDFIDAGDPYFVGDVEFFEDFEEDESPLQMLADEVLTLFKSIAKAAHKLSGQRGELPEIPQTKPEQLSFLIAAAFNLDTELKYQMLEIRSTSERLEKLREILGQTVNRVEDSAEIHKIAQTNGHTKKKINL
jgi:Lon protease-like protein